MSKTMLRAVSCVVLSLLALSGCGMTASREPAEKAVAEFHQRLDRGDFTAIYNDGHPELKKASSEKDFTAFLEAVHRKLGKVESAEQTNWRINTFNLQTYAVLNYQTKFAEGSAVETFTYRLDGDKAVLVGYHISSQALILK